MILCAPERHSDLTGERPFASSAVCATRARQLPFARGSKTLKTAKNKIEMDLTLTSFVATTALRRTLTRAVEALHDRHGWICKKVELRI